MSIAFDLHTHTLNSGHAYSTLEELAAYVSTTEISGFAVTDHGPAMPGAPVDLYFLNQRSLPRKINDVIVLRGAEVNILDFNGKVDLNKGVLKKLDICIASFHVNTRAPGTCSEHTAAWEAVLQNPLIDILGHPGRGDYQFDYEHIVRMCKQYNKMIEINNHTLDRPQYHDDCIKIAKACKQYGASVILSSDAHFSRHVGRILFAEALLAEIDFPEELILNRSKGKVIEWLKLRKPHFAAEYAEL